MSETMDVLYDVKIEVEKQDAKWGPQDHPDGTSKEKFTWMADLAKMACDQAHKTKTLSWAAILFEEFYEALAEEGSHALREELVQVAAVAVNWIKSIDRQQKRALRQLPDSGPTGGGDSPKTP